MDEMIFRNFSKSIKEAITISDADLKEIIAQCSVIQIRKNEFLLKEGQVCQYIYFINSGIVRHYYFTDHNEVTRWISMPNDFTSSLRSFISQTQSRENLQTITECEIVRMDRKAFKQLITSNFGFKHLWIKTLEYNYLTIEDRVFSLIEKSAEERFKWMMNFYPRFLLQIPVMYVASMLGITPRHFSRLKKKYSI